MSRFTRQVVAAASIDPHEVPMSNAVQNLAVVDADAHLTEPPDLRTSSLPGRWGDAVTHVAVDPSTGVERWRIGGAWCAGVGTQSQSGWGELPPSFPPTWADIDPACYDRAQRLDGWTSTEWARRSSIRT